MKKQRTRYPGVARMENGKFEIRVKIINPKNGKEKDIKRVVEAESPSAAAAIREVLRAEATVDPRERHGRVRLDDFATSWLESKTKTVKPSTADKYATVLDLHISPLLGGFFLDAIEPSDIREWVNRQKGKASTINGRLRVLRTLLADATNEYSLPRNPAARIQALREDAPSQDDPNRLTSEELAEVLAEFKRSEPEWYPLVVVIALTGMRFGEATALRWEDIDEDAGLIQVKRSQWKGKVGTTKTKRSVRSLPLPDLVVEALRAHRREMLKRQVAGLDKGWVFVNRAGGLYHTAALQKPLRRVLKKVGIDRRQTTHGFRRTFNNLARQFNSGEVVRALTGHVTEKMTEHYSHIETHEKRTAVDRVLASLRPKVEDPVEGQEPDMTTAGEDESSTGRNQ